MTKIDPYLHAVLLLHGAGQEITQGSLVAVLKAAKVETDEAKAKVLAEAVKSANFDELLKNTVVAQAAPAPTGGATQPAAESKKQENKEDEAKKEEAAAEGLANLFG